MRMVTLVASALGPDQTSVKAISVFTQAVHVKTLPISLDAFEIAMAEWDSGLKMVQQAFPTLSPADREFLMTGTTQAEWDAEFGDDDEPDWTDPCR